ncbi:MAG: heme-binding protein, partial [Hyphomicrobiales bacterium]
MDNAQIGSVEVAQRKAETAASFRRSTKVFEEMLVAGGAGLKMLSVADVCMLEGGLPIVKDGQIIGGIGVSGMASHQDAQVAVAGLAAVSAQ